MRGRRRLVAAVPALVLLLGGCSLDAVDPGLRSDATASSTTTEVAEDVATPTDGEVAAETDTDAPEDDPAISSDGRWRWAASGPGGGGSFSAPSVAVTGDVLVGSDLSGAYLRLAGSAGWTLLGADRGLTDTHVSATVFDPDNAEVFLLGTDGGIHRTLDGGRTIERVADGGYTTALVATGGGRFLAARAPEWNESGTSIWVSEDRGATWVELAAAPRADAYVLGFRSDPATPERLLALSGPSRFAPGASAVFESLDGGATWAELPLPGAPLDLRHDRDGAWWLSTAEGGTGTVFRSDDLVEWEIVAADLTGVVIPVPGDDTAGDVVRIADLGRWSRDPAVAPVVAIGADGTPTDLPAEDGWDPGWSSAPWAFEFGFDGAVRSSAVTADGGLVWVNGQFVFELDADGRTARPLHTQVSDSGWVSAGIDNTVPFDVSVSPFDPDDVLVGFADLGLWASADGGGSWNGLNTPEWTGAWNGAGGNATAVAHDPTRADRAWAVLGGDIGDGPPVLLRRDGDADRGVWVAVAGPADDPTRITDLTVAADGGLGVVVDGTAWLGSVDGDGPVVWSELTDCGDGCQVVAAGGTSWFAGGPSGVFDAEGPVLTVEGSEGEPAWWSPAYGGVSDLAVVRGGAEIWAAVTGPDGGFWQSVDGGTSWTLALADGWARGVSVADDVPGRVLVTSSSATMAGGYDPTSTGVQISTDGGRTFADATGDLPWPFGLRVAAADDVVWVASPGRGPVVAEDPFAG